MNHRAYGNGNLSQVKFESGLRLNSKLTSKLSPLERKWLKSVTQRPPLFPMIPPRWNEELKMRKSGKPIKMNKAL